MLSDLIKLGIEFREREPLSGHCTFRVGGNAEIALFPKDKAQLCEAVKILRGAGVKYAVVGHGSNILFTDSGYSGAVIFTNGINEILFTETGVTCGAGLSMRRLAEKCGLERGFAGFEFMHGIPGTVGGGVFMNAGAFGGEIADILIKSTYFDTETDAIRELNASEHGFAYRFCGYQTHPERIILSAEFECKPGDANEIKRKISDFSARRREKQPLNYPSAGSTFKRTDGYIIAKLIDDCGLKGLTVGGAQVSELHAGFIVNRGNATACEILELIDIVKEKVFERFGVTPECEIRIVGD